MAQIKIKPKENNLAWHCDVEITDDDGSLTAHKVTMDRDFVTRMGADYKPGKVVEKTIEFLLSKESKEAILPEFDVSVVSHYFPDYITSLEKLLQNDPSPLI